jgi:hypothetical protein
LYEDVPDKDGSRVVAFVNGSVALVTADVWVVYQKTGGEGDTGMERKRFLQTAVNQEITGIISKEDYLILAGYMRAKPGPMSDEELNWLIELLNSTRLAKMPNRYFAQSKILSVFGLNTQPTPAQKERIYQATIPFLTLDEPKDRQYALLKHDAMIELQQLKDARAIPLIVPLLNDSRLSVRNKAQDTLRALGYVDPAASAETPSGP